MGFNNLGDVLNRQLFKRFLLAVAGIVTGEVQDSFSAIGMIIAGKIALDVAVKLAIMIVIQCTTEVEGFTAAVFVSNAVDDGLESIPSCRCDQLRHHLVGLNFECHPERLIWLLCHCRSEGSQEI